jgi:hypothetical protein
VDTLNNKPGSRHAEANRCRHAFHRHFALTLLWTSGVLNSGRFFILILTLASSGCVWRSDVTCETGGRVLDEATKQPVPAAKLYDIRYPKQAVTTSADGIFDFQRVIAWHHVPLVFPGPDLTTNRFLIIEAKGYRTAEVNMPLQFDWPDRIIYLTPTNAP